jgi:hypothetical protein
LIGRPFDSSDAVSTPNIGRVPSDGWNRLNSTEFLWPFTVADTRFGILASRAKPPAGLLRPTSAAAAAAAAMAPAEVPPTLRRVYWRAISHTAFG